MNRTLQENNKFTFKCPILHCDVEMGTCATTQYHHMRGDKTENRACQALMASSKCPLVPFSRRFQRGVADELYSEEPKSGTLPLWLLDEVAPIIPQEAHLTMFGVSPEDRDLILDPSQVKFVGGTPSPAPPAHKRRTTSPTKPSRANVIEAVDKEEPSVGGNDFAAAINVAMREIATDPSITSSEAEVIPIPKLISSPKPAVPSPASSEPAVKKPSLLELARMKRGAA